MHLVPNKQLLFIVPFQTSKNRKKELCMDRKVQKTIGGAYCATCSKEKFVYISTNRTTSFCDCKKCKACCHVLNIPSMDQKPTTMLFGCDATQCFARNTCSDYEKEKPSLFLKEILGQSPPSTSEPELKKAEIISFMA